MSMGNVARPPPAPPRSLAYGTVPSVLEYSGIPGPGMMDTLSYSIIHTGHHTHSLVFYFWLFVLVLRSVGRSVGWHNSAGEQAGIPCRTII